MNSKSFPSSFKRLLLFVFLTSSITSFGQDVQEDTPNKFWQHVRFGGGIGLSFGDGFFSGTLAPAAIYEFNDQVAAGIGLNATYNSLKDQYNSTILGGSAIVLYNPIQEIQISAELEQLNVNRNFEERLGIEDENFWVPAFFLGAGYRTNNVTVGVRYDFLYDEEESIYANAWMPFVRVFF